MHKMWLRITVSAGVVAAANRAAFVDDLAANIIANCRFEYASKTLQEFKGDQIKFYNRLMYHDVAREAYNAQGYAGLPPGKFIFCLCFSNLKQEPEEPKPREKLLPAARSFFTCL